MKKVNEIIWLLISAAIYLVALVILICLFGCEGKTVVIYKYEDSPTPPQIETVDCVQHDLPETWLAIGQSNMQIQSGQGSLELGEWADIVGNALVTVRQINLYDQADIEDWEALEDVDQFAEVPGYFGVNLSELLGQEVRILSSAIGGTALDCWQEGGGCNGNAIKPWVNEEIEIDGVIWWQGESDYSQGTVDDYGERLKVFLKGLRDDFNARRLPVIIVGMERYCANWSNDIPQDTCTTPDSWYELKAQQQLVADEDPYTEIVDIESITNGAIHPYDSYPLVGAMLAEKTHQVVYDECVNN